MGVNPHSLMTFKDLQRQLVHLRLSVYEALLEHGPCTTRELATACGIDLLTVRPRMTELLQCGFVVDTSEEGHGHEGTYRALTLIEAEAAFDERQSKATEQMNLSI